MAKILNFGSMNIDYVYTVDHFVRPGETTSSSMLNTFCGGKGLNQSIALARAGAEIYHAGAVGQTDGKLLTDAMQRSGANIDLIERRECSSGHAMIQIDAKGQNCILLYGGANQTMTSDYIDRVLQHFSAGDFVVLQNEINLVEEIMHKAKAIGMRIVLNPSPMDEKILSLPLELVDYFMLNEVEAADICGGEESLNKADLIDALCAKYPHAAVVLTLGKQGVVYKDSQTKTPLTHGIYDVKVVDTTAAGDTFTGYFIASIARGETIGESLRLASVASSISVSRSGAEPSIPTLAEVAGTYGSTLKPKQ